MSAPFTCADVCQALWPDPSPGGAAWEHYMTCRICQQFFVRDRRLAQRVASLEAGRAPGELRLRVALVLDHSN